MIHYVVGDLFASEATVLVNTVNTVGVMGKGIAKDFRRRYPHMFKEYRALCKQGRFDVGQLLLYKTPHKWILNFPTKRHWRNKSKIEYIEAGLKKFVSIYEAEGIESIAFPMLGCGNGQLDWESEIKPLMEEYLADLPIKIYIYLYGLRDSQKILTFLDELKRQPWIGNRKWWPDYLFHFTDIKNAVSVLNSGFLFSRAEAERQKILKENSASQQIISQTSAELTDHVRLYFRPHTPTTYHMEGFKPLNQLFQDAHCPVPVYFLFDMREVITLNNTRFSNGNLAAYNSNIFTSADDFTQLSFEDIYHNTPFREELPEERAYITTARQAEVIYPKKISLDYLKYIGCRSQAEYDTLRNLLPPAVWKQWQSKIAISKGQRLFNKEWLYIEDVTLTKKNINIKFNLPKKCEYFGPFKIGFDIKDLRTNNPYPFTKKYSDIVSKFRDKSLDLNLSGIDMSAYDVKVSIDGKLAYSGKYTEHH